MPLPDLGDRTGPGEPPAPDMVWMNAGEFRMGSDEHYEEEAPTHRVRVDGFWIDRTPVTNDAFGRFVQATGYVTVAQRPPTVEDYPGADPQLLVAASSVFRQPDHRVDLGDPYGWWTFVPGADWRHPGGPGTSIDDLANHPVVHVAWDDVEAFAAWTRKELPTEAEWEFAARGGLDGAEFVWGDEFAPGGRYQANTWQGEFPVVNERLDGYERTSPVDAFPANGFGLHDMAGNVWEWTQDWYGHHGPAAHACCAVPDPRGATREQSVDVRDAAAIPRKVMKGGSHLCAPNYCRRYRPAARMPQPVDTSTSHLGFRCVVRPR